MSFVDYFTYPFKFFVSLIGDMAGLGLLWAVIVGLCACGVSYLINMAITRGKRHD